MPNQFKGSPTEPRSAQSEPKPTPYWGLSANDFYRTLANKPIKITAMDGKLYSGTLIGIDQYDLFIRQANGLTILFAKHALKFVHADASEPINPKEKTE
jgi:hypothetical protein